jgi:hypothetical protein
MIEVFPHEHTWTALNCKTGHRSEGTVRYRFVPIPTPQGWTTYPGQQCHDGLDGLLIEDDKARWWEQDLWGATGAGYSLDIGCYGGIEEYVCYAHVSDWRGEELERVSFEQAEDAVAWALRWMADPQAEVARCNRTTREPRRDGKS